ncbi:MAG: hypothetical protein LLG04_17655 [Parachlamydia sp.]|nr:hypothetical protein [Parachlamydia sp.]
MSDGDAVKILSLTRQLMEQTKRKDSYSILNFYCNWCFHTSISSSNVCYRMLLSITDVFLSDDGSKRVNIPLEVSNLLSLKELRAQFKDLYQTDKLPTFLFDYLSNWRGFTRQILKEIIHKPISFLSDKEIAKNKTASKIKSELLSKAGNRPMMMAHKLWLSDTDGGKKGEVWWFVETMPNVRICGQLGFTESVKDFLPES